MTDPRSDDPMLERVIAMDMETLEREASFADAADDPTGVRWWALVEEELQARIATELSNEPSGFTQVHVVLTGGQEFIVEVEEAIDDALQSVDRRICDRTPVGARGIRETQESVYIFPPTQVDYLAARP